MADPRGPRPDPPSLAVLQKLIAQEHSSLLARALWLCRNDADAQDLVQSRAARALERASSTAGAAVAKDRSPR